VGLYLAPPDRALVLCLDEKTQIQAPDRSQPVLPMRPGQPQRRSHDYLRHGTTTLFAALDAKTGKVLGGLHRRHRSLEFGKFLDRIEAAVPAGLDVHLILDNYGTHKTALIRQWLAKRPHYHVHFTPTGHRGSTWSNAFRAADAEADPARHSSQHARTGTSDPALSGHLQPDGETFRLDENCRPNPRQCGPILSANFSYTTLAYCGSGLSRQLIPVGKQ